MQVRGSTAPLQHMAKLRKQAGLSIVELLVGMTVGLIVASMAGLFLIGNVTENKRMLVELRLMSDMRAAMDVVTRDLRRAGYWQNSSAGLSNVTGFTPYSTVPYNVITGITGGVEYSYSTDANDTVDDGEAFGFKVDGNTLKLRLGSTAGYQELTDPSITEVEEFTITPTTLLAPVGCATACTMVASLTDTCPKVTVRSYDIYLRAKSANTSGDDTITRELRSTARVRNDIPSGTCAP